MSGLPDLPTLVQLALQEDVGAGDWTTLWTVPETAVVQARIVAKGNGVIAGTEAAAETFRAVDPSVQLEFSRPDGATVCDGDIVATLEGPARSILTSERVALNFLQRLSGVATLTRKFVDAIAGTGARILDTRKTTPLMRALEKQAVLAAGGSNHRVGLFDMVLVKENHIRAAGGISAAVEAVRRQSSGDLAIEVETSTLEEVREVLGASVDRVLFDNMSIPMLRQAVSMVRDSGIQIETEASGGIALSTIRRVAETGVDFISLGALTHSPPALDLSLLVSAG
ncbi:MAG: carboxylating nicotinate-nucleotide diphosphorylase [Gemmatimonas sp.]|nr:carboxylating nicotinate-nucleotide diphosphorylase [Gemmatimonas sp.]